MQWNGAFSFEFDGKSKEIETTAWSELPNEGKAIVEQLPEEKKKNPNSAEPRVYLGISFTCVTVNLDYWPLWWGLRGRKFLILIILDHWKRHFQEKNYIENYFY